MSFSPDPLNLGIYKKGRTIPVANVVLDPDHTPKSSFRMYPRENWTSIQYIGDRTFQVSLNKSVVDKMAVGSYTGEVKITYDGTYAGFKKKRNEYFDVNFVIQNTINLAVSPTNFTFTHTIGQAQPRSKFFSITSENSWTLLADAAWITTNRTQGTGNASVEVGVDVTGLSNGQYSGTILVDDGYGKKTAQVNLIVYGENTADDFLICKPDSLEFLESYNKPSSATRKLNIETSDAVAITTNVPWLDFSKTYITPGIESIQVSTQNTEAMNFGTYLGKITITSSYSTQVVPVMLTINEAVIGGVVDNGFYYADDRNIIAFSNTVAESELVLDFDTITATDNLNYQKTIPFFRGVAKSILGQEAKNLIRGYDQFSSLQTGIIEPVAPLNMNIQVYDKIIDSTQRTTRDTLSNIKVMLGKTPTVANWLSEIPNAIVTAKDGIVAFSFRADTPPDEIVVTGDATQTFSASGISGGIYTCIVKLEDLSLSANQAINIACGGFSVGVNIIASEPEHTRIAWLNQWGCPEIFTCRGYLEIEDGIDQVEATYAEEGRERIQILDVDNPITYTIKTGFIFSRAEVDWLRGILRAKKIWIEIDGQFVPVIRNFKKLAHYETRNFLFAYELKFESALV